jgi:hypothetical protein
VTKHAIRRHLHVQLPQNWIKIDTILSEHFTTKVIAEPGSKHVDCVERLLTPPPTTGAKRDRLKKSIACFSNPKRWLQISWTGSVQQVKSGKAVLMCFCVWVIFWMTHFDINFVVPFGWLPLPILVNV